MTSRLAHRLALAVAALLPLPAAASYVEREEGRAFIREMVERHGFDAVDLSAALARASHDPTVIRLITPPDRPGSRSWRSYRARFLDPLRIGGGVRFWEEYEALLQKAAEQYGVPPEIVTAIIGVETVYGQHTGNFETMSALATLAFDYPRRADLFRGELEALFLLAREQGRDPASYYGSYAGALGYPWRRFAGLSVAAGICWAVYSIAIGVLAGAWLKDQPLLSAGLGIVLALSIGLVIDRVVALRARRTSASPDSPSPDRMTSCTTPPRPRPL